MELTILPYPELDAMDKMSARDAPFRSELQQFELYSCHH